MVTTTYHFLKATHYTTHARDVYMCNKVAVALWAGCGLQTSAQARVTHYMLASTLRWSPSLAITPGRLRKGVRARTK